MAKIKFWCIMAMLSIMVIDLTGHCITVRRDLLHKREEKEERGEERGGGRGGGREGGGKGAGG